VYGTQLNGLTTGADFGDDAKMATNYPLVYLTNSSQTVTLFARTHNFDQMAPRPGIKGSFQFETTSVLVGQFTVHVSASGLSATGPTITLPQPDRGVAWLASRL
jgi:hypothetical protein